MTEWDRLTPLHLDALREVGNIGAGNAATALATMLGRQINMEVPRAGVLPLAELLAMGGAEEQPVACVTLTLKGQAPGSILFLLDKSSSYALVDFLLGRAPGTTGALGEMEMSVLLEVGNILTGSFLNAFAQVTDLEFIPSVPAMAFDMLASVVSTALIEEGYFEDQILVIETRFFDATVAIDGHFLLVPMEGSLTYILKGLGLEL